MTKEPRILNKEHRTLKLLVIAKDEMSSANTSCGNLPLKHFLFDQGDRFVVKQHLHINVNASSR